MPSYVQFLQGCLFVLCNELLGNIEKRKRYEWTEHCKNSVSNMYGNNFWTSFCSTGNEEKQKSIQGEILEAAKEQNVRSACLTTVEAFILPLSLEMIKIHRITCLLSFQRAKKNPFFFWTPYLTETHLPSPLSSDETKKQKCTRTRSVRCRF